MTSRRRLAVLLLFFVIGAAVAVLFGDVLAGRVPADLGPRDGTLAPCPDRPNCVSSLAHDAAHRVAPIPYSGDGQAALARLASMIADMPGATVVTRRDGYLHATFRSRIMGFVDDLEVLAVANRGVFELRSAARLGYRDFGVNRDRVTALAAAFAAAPP